MRARSLLLLAVFAAGCHPEARSHQIDVEFARQTFLSLSQGDPVVGGLIDWDQFQVEGVTVGAMIKALPFGVGRETMKSTAIASFAASMKHAGWSAGDLSAWRFGEVSGTRTTVSATTPGGKVVVLTVEHLGADHATRALAGVDVGIGFKL